MEGSPEARPLIWYFVQRGWSIPYLFYFVKWQKCANFAAKMRSQDQM